MTTIEALSYIKAHGIVAESGHGSVPSLAEAIAGRRIRGSWWSHPKRQEIFIITRAVRDSEDVLVCRLLNGRVTYVHRRVWPALVRLVEKFNIDNLGRIREVHSSRGEHQLHIIRYPRWVPAEVKSLARKMSEKQANDQLGTIVLESHDRPTRRGG